MSQKFPTPTSGLVFRTILKAVEVQHGDFLILRVRYCNIVYLYEIEVLLLIKRWKVKTTLNSKETAEKDIVFKK